MAIGSHRLEYEVVQGWERLPEGWAFTEVVGSGWTRGSASSSSAGVRTP